MEKCKAFNVPLYMCFIDYTKAFDCVSHNQLWQIMRQMGFPMHIVDLMCSLYKEQESAVRTSYGDTNWFRIERGVRQGCVMSPTLYNIYSEEIMREIFLDYEGGVKVGGRQITNLRFADDTTLICSSKQELLDLLKQTKEASEKRGLLLNTRKTKIMVIDKNRTDFSDFLLEDEKIEEVEEFTYLGSIIDTKCSSAKEIKRRIGMAKSTVHNLTTIWKSRGVSIGLKIRLLKSTAFAIALYGCESWAPTEADRKKINAFEMWCYRKLLRVSWTEKRTNEWILDKIGSDLELLKNIAERKMKLFGHIVRRGGLERQIVEGKMEGKRGRGRPQTSWLTDIKQWTGGSIAASIRQAESRTGWSALVKTTAARCAN